MPEWQTMSPRCLYLIQSVLLGVGGWPCYLVSSIPLCLAGYRGWRGSPKRAWDEQGAGY